MLYFHRRRSKIEQTQEIKSDNKQPEGKQHADNQAEVDTTNRGGKGEKEEETGREKE